MIEFKILLIALGVTLSLILIMTVVFVLVAYFIPKIERFWLDRCDKLEFNATDFEK